MHVNSCFAMVSCSALHCIAAVQSSMFGLAACCLDMMDVVLFTGMLIRVSYQVQMIQYIAW